MTETNEEEKRRRKAIALRYDSEEDQAPRVIAKGSGYVAERILELAQEHDLPIHEDPDLVALLAKLDVGSEIPEALYRAIAEVLAFVYQVNRAAQGKAS